MPLQSLLSRTLVWNARPDLEFAPPDSRVLFPDKTHSPIGEPLTQLAFR